MQLLCMYGTVSPYNEATNKLAILNNELKKLLENIEVAQFVSYIISL